MDHRRYVFAKRHDTYCIAHVQACLYALIDDAAYQSHEDTLCLIALYKSNTFLSARS